MNDTDVAAFVPRLQRAPTSLILGFLERLLLGFKKMRAR
jgi:hypothetical protein